MATPQRKDLLDYDKPDPASATKGGSKGSHSGAPGAKGDQAASREAASKAKKKHAAGSGMNKKAMLAMLGVVVLLGAVAAYMNLYADNSEKPTAEEMKELTTPPPPYVVPGKPVPKLGPTGVPITPPANELPPSPA